MRGRADLQELIEFAFESRVARSVPLAALLRIADGSRRCNSQCGLTGELHLRGESFRYVVEGSCQVVLPLAARILADERHRSIRIIALGAIERRRFDGWNTLGFDLPDDRDERAATDVRFLAARRPLAPRTSAALALSR